MHNETFFTLLTFVMSYVDFYYWKIIVLLIGVSSHSNYCGKYGRCYYPRRLIHLPLERRGSSLTLIGQFWLQMSELSSNFHYHHPSSRIFTESRHACMHAMYACRKACLPSFVYHSNQQHFISLYNIILSHWMFFSMLPFQLKKKCF